MDQSRILELAIQELERQKTAVAAEIEAISAELRETGTNRRASLAIAAVAGKRRRTPAERKAQSEKMRKIWAARRQHAAAATAKPIADKSGASKSRSEAMKAAWAKRKAQAAGKPAKSAS